ncbi:SPO22-domain-containing protein [Astrocystis sublimbata]|nr:SPO22-domain-containing protein [Astrocystis sublimbata]
MDDLKTPSAANRGQLVDAVIRLSSHLRTLSFAHAAELATEKLNDDIDSQVQALKTHDARPLTAEHRTQLTAAGLDLWNWGTRERRRVDSDGSVPPGTGKFFCLVRLLSFSMLVLARQTDDHSQRSILHLEQLAIKTTRTCIATKEIESGLWALQKAVEYNGRLQPPQGSPSGNGSLTSSQFEVKCSTLRVAWKGDRMDVADHVYGKLESLVPNIDAVSAEKTADALFEIGRDLAQKKNLALAGKWLERAYELINALELGQLSRDAIELRLAISQTLIQVYLEIGGPDYMSRAENHIAYVESELGDKLIVLLFRTELLLRSPNETFDSEAYADIIRRMMRSIDMTESSFNLLIHHIRKLDVRNRPAAISVLDDFFLPNILGSQQEQWIDKAIMLRTYIATRDGPPEFVQGLEVVLDKVLPCMGKPLPVNAAVGMHTLIWKKADADFSQGEFCSAAKWYNLALHPALEQSGPSNLGEILQAMNDDTLKEPMTAYLAFRVALKQEDADSALRCLNQISETSSTGSECLYACCLEAQQVQDKITTIKALQLIVHKRRSHLSSSIHLPALLRVLIRLEVSVLTDEKESNREKEGMVEDLCNIFKAAADEIQKERRDCKSDKLFTVEELDWFCKNAYNLGLEKTMIWDARHIISMLECCLSILPSYPPDIPAQKANDNSLRAMFCNFMAATVLLALARSNDNTESRLQDYLDMRSHDDLKSIVLKAKAGQSLSAYQAMADCILRCESVPPQVLYQTMRDLINQIWALENFGNEKLAKYMRCLLKVTLPMEHGIPLNLIDEISSKKQFPFMELEWITITAFNHGVDLFGLHEDELSKAWISHALTIAHYLPDGGELERQLQEKHTKLKWDDVPAAQARGGSI